MRPRLDGFPQGQSSGSIPPPLSGSPGADPARAGLHSPSRSPRRRRCAVPRVPPSPSLSRSPTLPLRHPARAGLPLALPSHDGQIVKPPTAHRAAATVLAAAGSPCSLRPCISPYVFHPRLHTVIPAASGEPPVDVSRRRQHPPASKSPAALLGSRPPSQPRLDRCADRFGSTPPSQPRPELRAALLRFDSAWDNAIPSPIADTRWNGG
ncbi:hypothetical protein PVAP13_1KG257010 [Panicum virgatum]|uniref:Uncharacterized protein n=1 Tax=Panicum virgatum TaxID=38727 RepID=A0A8T0XMM3_PANVG|nr:hypothetical protein PVAP13_1KG257010 [Panicum virgatum]